MADKFLSCSILTPTGIVFEDDISMVVAPSVDGEVGVLPMHASYICSLKVGPLRVKNGEEEQLFAISKGYMEVNQDKVSIIVDTAEPAHKIDLDRAQRAMHEAEQKIREKADNTEYEGAQADLERALNRINVGNKNRQ